VLHRRVVGSLVGIAMLACAPAAAVAQDGDGDRGVTIDPDSPSAREYEIPLESARRDAEPGRDRRTPVQQGERGAPLFGAGISSDDAGATGGKGSGGAGGPNRATRPASSVTSTKKAAEPAAVGLAVADPGAPDSGAGTSALVIAGGALVLGFGAGAGVLARRRVNRS
jgi:hypothetical protein